MRLISLAAVLALTAACTNESTPFAPAAKDPAAFDYPLGIRSVLGVAPTMDFLAHDVAAAADRKRLHDDGFGIVRFDLLWQDVEPSPEVWNYDRFDVIVDDLLAQGFTPLLILVYGNPAYDDAGRPCPQPDGYAYTCLGSDLGPYLRFAARTAARYRGKVRLYEIWNEPNGWFRFWPRVVGGDPAAYAQMTAGAADAIHGACDDCQVLSGGMVYLPSPISMSQPEFMASMREAVPDVFEKVDGVGFHAYTFYPPVDPPESQSLNQTPLDEALADVRAACACDKPLWITETGWTAVGDLSEDDRARFALRGFLLSLTQGAQSWLWWSVRDYHAEIVVAPQETHFGLLDRDGRPHPVYSALAAMTATIGDALRVEDVRGEYGFEAPYAWAIRLTMKDGSNNDILWYGGRGEAPPLPPRLRGAAAVRLRDLEKITLGGLDGDPVLIRRLP